MAAPGYPAYDPLFMALAQAKSQPSHAFRTAMSALDIPGEALQGLQQGLQIRNMINQPKAMQALYGAVGGPNAASLPSSAFYGMSPKDVLEYGTGANKLAAQYGLGMAGINERNTASQRAADAAAARTAAFSNLGGARNLSSNIALHENEIQRLSNENSQLASKVPGGIGGTIQALLGRGGDISQYLQDPKFGQIAAQMKSNQNQINWHQQILQPMYKAQGLVPQNLLDNSDLNGINPQTGNGGDTSQSTSLPGLEF